MESKENGTASRPDQVSCEIQGAPKEEPGGQNLVEDMLNSNIVTTTDKFKVNIAKKSKKLSDQDREKIAEMVRGLAKYREVDMEGDSLDIPIPSPNKFKKSPAKDIKNTKNPSGSSLQEYLKSEMDSVTASIEASKKKESSQNLDEKSNALSKPEASNAQSEISKPSISKEQEIAELPEFKFNFNPPHVDLSAEFDRLNMVHVGQDVTTKQGKGKKRNKDKNQAQQLQESVEKSDNSASQPSGKNKKSPKAGSGQGQGGRVGSYTQLLNTMGRPNKDGRDNKDNNFAGQFERLQIQVSCDQSERPEREITCSPKGDNTGGKKKKDKAKSPKKQELLEQRASPIQRRSSSDSVSSHASAVASSTKSPVQKDNKGSGSDVSPGKTKKQKKKEKKEQEAAAAAEKAQLNKKKRSDDKDWRANLPRYGSPQEQKRDFMEKKNKPMPAEVCLDEETVVKVNVPKEDHQYLMGPQRSNLIDICNMTGVMIEVPTKSEPSEEIVLRGDKLQVGPALALMFAKCQQSKNEMLVAPCVRPKEMSPVCAQVKKGQGQQQKRAEPDLDPDLITQNRNQNANRGANWRNPGLLGISPGYGRGQVQYGQGQYNQGQYGQGQYGQGQYNQGQYGQGQSQYGQGQYNQGQYGQGQGQYNQGQGQYVRGDNYGNKQYRNDGNQDDGQGHGQGRGRGQGQPQGHRDGMQGNNCDQGRTLKGQGKRQRKKKDVFADYMPMEEVSHGLKRGTLIQGPVRINPKQFEEAYIPHPDGKSDILIHGLPDRNRALNTDEVAVMLYEEGDWLLKKNALQDIEATHKGEQDGDDSDEAEVVIESEETVEVMQPKGPKVNNANINSATAGVSSLKIDTDCAKQSTDNQSPCQKNGNKGGNKKDSLREKYTTLSEVMTGGSPVARRALGTEGSVDARKMLQRTGKVVAILERKHSRACTGHLKPHMVDRALLLPTDHRIPRMMIPLNQCPPNFVERPEDHAQTLFVGRIVDWRKDSVYADGCLMKSLGLAGEIEPETEGMLIENGVDFEEFPQQALDCLPATPWRIPESEFEYRRDFRKACVFTIDPATARDLDDAVSCEDLGDGRYRVGVHIADVSYFIPEESVLDKVASIRATSVYLVHKVIPMLPRLLCEELCSLNPDEDRLTFSVEWILNEEGEIEEEWFGRSVIRSCVKLAYDHAQGFIEQPDRIWATEELPSISEGFNIADIKSRVLQLDKIAKNMRAARFDGGALRLDQVKLQYSLDKESGMPNGYSVYQQRDSNKLIEEFMLLANMAVAHKINNDFPDKALLRRHPEPKEKMIETLRDQCRALGINLDITSAGTLHRSLNNYCDDDEFSMARMQVLTALCSKPMQNAKYFCNGCIDDESLYRHYALNVPLYTHFTSPIRRYPDVLVHRALAASLDYCQETERSSTMINRMAEHCNDKKTAAKRVGDLSCELFFAVFVKTAGPLEEKAMVMAVFDKAFDIFVLKLGVSKRVYCNRLPIKEKIYKTDRKVPSLTLVWLSEKEGEPEQRQEVTIFTVVDCVLEQGDMPLQWMATIKRPVQVFPP